MTIITNAFSKKRRLLEAFTEVEEQSLQNHNNTIIRSSNKRFCTDNNHKNGSTIKMDCSTDTIELERIYPIPTILSTRVINLFNAKLQIFEQWETNKRKALEQFSRNVELLSEKETKLEKLRTIYKENERKRKELLQKLQTNINSINTSELSQQKLPKHQYTNVKNSKIIESLTESNPTTITKYKISQKSEKLTPIGPNGTLVPVKTLQLINWQQPTAATRKLLMSVFDRDTLAFHTLTGKPSPAFMGCGRPLKDQLNPKKVADIIHIVMQRTKAPERDIRSAITTKCADENKMFKQRQRRKDKLTIHCDGNKENIPYQRHNLTY